MGRPAPPGGAVPHPTKTRPQGGAGARCVQDARCTGRRHRGCGRLRTAAPSPRAALRAGLSASRWRRTEPPVSSFGLRLFSKTRRPCPRGRFRGGGARPAPLPYGVGMGRRGRPRRARKRARESLSLHVTRKRGNPHSRPLTQMTIFGNVRQWNRPRALRPGGGVGGWRRSARTRAASAPP